ncbi:hypothetical protein LDL08_35380 [Nonomuraea glycinis]|uniref:hypothetical protein n=1 Tax=Nonomuraea glycinis TaxID=2047744 RepID=UPI001665FADE|nr:hypothetical protein [Nonomuraea glycinis]MCA2181457.1 hypothetical protein [Nonomuraea glycinis]
MNRRAGRPQGGPKGSTNEANALAEFLLTLTREMTVRELAGRYHVGKTLWGEYRTGQKIIPLELLRRLVRDHTPDERTRETRLETAARLHAAALEGAPHAPSITEPAPAPDLAMAPEPAAAPEPAPAAGGRRRLTLIGGGTAIALLALLILLLVWRPANVAGIADGPGTPDAGGATAVLPASTEVFTIAPGGRGIFQWDGENAAGWTKIGDSARQLWAGSAGLFATGMDNRLYLYEGRPGRWHPISEPGADFAIAGSHLYRLAADRQSIHIWNGRGTSWMRIGGSAARLYGGELGLFAIALKDGSIFRYTGRPDQWTFTGSAGATFALTGKHLYGLIPNRTAVTLWLDEQPRVAWIHAAGPAGDLYGGIAGLFSTDPAQERLRVLMALGTDPANQSWQDIGPAGAEVRVGRRDVYVLSKDRSEILCWSRDTGTWRRIGGPAQTLAVRPTPSTSTIPESGTRQPSRSVQP